MLPKQAIDEFKRIYLQEDGIQLSDQEAVALGNNLMGLYKKLVKTDSKFELNPVSHIDKNNR